MSAEPILEGTPRERAYRQIAEGLELQAQGYRLLAVAEPPAARPVALADKSRLMTRKEVQERLRKSASWVRDACVRGALPGVKIGDEWCVQESDVELFIRRGQRAARR